MSNVTQEVNKQCFSRIMDIDLILIGYTPNNKWIN